MATRANAAILVGIFTQIKLVMTTLALEARQQLLPPLAVLVELAELHVLAMVIVNKMEKYAGVEESLAPMVWL